VIRVKYIGASHSLYTHGDTGTAIVGCIHADTIVIPWRTWVLVLWDRTNTVGIACTERLEYS